MKKAILITADNFKTFLGMSVDVEICCKKFGMMYPDNNVLVGYSRSSYYFLSNKGTEDEQYWHWTFKDDKDCSIEVWYHPKTSNVENERPIYTRDEVYQFLLEQRQLCASSAEVKQEDEYMGSLRGYEPVTKIDESSILNAPVPNIDKP